MALNPCCCMSSRTGATIIGIFQIILYATCIIGVLFCYSTVSRDLSVQALKEQLTQVNNQFIDDPNYQDWKIEDETFFNALYIFLICVLVGCIIGLFLASILIHGIRTENPQLLKFHLIIYSTLFCISWVGAIAYLAMGQFLPTLAIYGLGFYFLRVFYYAYLEVREKVSHRQTILLALLINEVAQLECLPAPQSKQPYEKMPC
ncbi:unnamed protein product [Orchesella dallaii]|uniref:Uncharacterized protein n=1 Tax=Orchesella dallaii TaxID=48710 RepID=A0ABP1R6R8_9HEXA